MTIDMMRIEIERLKSQVRELKEQAAQAWRLYAERGSLIDKLREDLHDLGNLRLKKDNDRLNEAKFRDLGGPRPLHVTSYDETTKIKELEAEIVRLRAAGFAQERKISQLVDEKGHSDFQLIDERNNLRERVVEERKKISLLIGEKRDLNSMLERQKETIESLEEDKRYLQRDDQFKSRLRSAMSADAASVGKTATFAITLTEMQKAQVLTYSAVGDEVTVFSDGQWRVTHKGPPPSYGRIRSWRDEFGGSVGTVKEPEPDKPGVSIWPLLGWLSLFFIGLMTLASVYSALHPHP